MKIKDETIRTATWTYRASQFAKWWCRKLNRKLDVAKVRTRIVDPWNADFSQSLCCSATKRRWVRVGWRPPKSRTKYYRGGKHGYSLWIDGYIAGYNFPIVNKFEVYDHWSWLSLGIGYSCNRQRNGHSIRRFGKHIVTLQIWDFLVSTRGCRPGATRYLHIRPT